MTSPLVICAAIVTTWVALWIGRRLTLGRALTREEAHEICVYLIVGLADTVSAWLLDHL